MGTCVSCKHWIPSATDLEFVCWCRESEYFAEHTPELHGCEEWEDQWVKNQKFVSMMTMAISTVACGFSGSWMWRH